MIAMDRPFWLRTLIITTFLIWPLLIFGQPAYFYDSVGYYQGGKTGVEFVENKLHIGSKSLPATVAANAQNAEAAGSAPAPARHGSTKVARSIIYSVMGYLLSWPGASMAMLAVAQAMFSAVVASVMLAAFGLVSRKMAVAVGLVLAFATPAAFVSMFIMPDIYAGIIVGVTALLVAYHRRMTLPIKGALILIGALSVAVHTSHPPLAAVMCAVGGLWVLLDKRENFSSKFVSMFIMGLPLVVGIGMLLLSGLIGFGEMSVAPKRFPLTLARAIDNGPGRWYLDKECPVRHYTVCELFNNKMPDTNGKFLWGPEGVVMRATPEQMDKIRAEESEIVWRSTLAYPQVQINQMIRSIPAQIVAIGMSEIRFQRQVVPDGKGSVRMVTVSQDRDPAVDAVEMATYITTALSLLIILLSFKTMTRAHRGMLLVIVTGLLTNAIICAVFSAVSDRYQSRIIWLIPLFALCLLRTRVKRATDDT